MVRPVPAISTPTNANAIVYTSPAATETFPAGTLIANLDSGSGVIAVGYPVDGLQNPNVARPRPLTGARVLADHRP